MNSSTLSTQDLKNENFYKVVVWPLNYFRSGGMLLGYFAARLTGQYLWSGVAGGKDDDILRARDFYSKSDTGFVYTQNIFYRGRGYSIRCGPGTRSFSYLINHTYGIENQPSQNPNPYPDIMKNNFSQIVTWPINYLRSGFYLFSTGQIYARPTDEHFWSVASGSIIDNFSMVRHFYSSSPSSLIISQYNNLRGAGFSIRLCGLGYP